MASPCGLHQPAAFGMQCRYTEQCNIVWRRSGARRRGSALGQTNGAARAIIAVCGCQLQRKTAVQRQLDTWDQRSEVWVLFQAVKNQIKISEIHLGRKMASKLNRLAKKMRTVRLLRILCFSAVRSHDIHPKRVKSLKVLFQAAKNNIEISEMNLFGTKLSESSKSVVEVWSVIAGCTSPPHSACSASTQSSAT